MPVALVLDSDRQNADHLCRLLALLEVPAIPAYTWQAGLLLIEENQGDGQASIDLVFLGISECDGEGYELSESLHPKIPGDEIPIVLVAPAGCRNLVESLEQFGARATIAKPATLEAVASVLIGMNCIEK
jgi:hypothetical protein